MPFDIQSIIDDCYNDKEYIESLERKLRILDFGIEKIEVDEGYVRFYHVGCDDFFELYDEPSSVKRFIEIYPLIYYHLYYGLDLTIHDIDKTFHPMLTREVIRWFSDKDLSKLYFTLINESMLDFVTDYGENGIYIGDK